MVFLFILFLGLILGAFLIIVDDWESRFNTLIVASLLFLIGIGIVSIDSQKITTFSDRVLLADKWHEESCTPLYDSNSNYVGESCSDIWTFAGIVDGQRQEFTVEDAEFKRFQIGSSLQHTYSVGRLGFKHSDRWEATQKTL